MANAKSANLEQFLNSVVENEVSDIYVNCPELDEVEATVKDYSFFEGVTKGEDGETEQPWFSLSVNFIIDSDEAREVVGRDEVIVAAQFFITLNSAGGLNTKGNERLGKFLKVLNVPSAGRVGLEILEDMKGRSCLAKIRHIARMKAKEPVLDEEGNQVYDARVTAIARA